MPGAFQCTGHEFLVFLAGAGALAAEDLGMGRHEAPQKLCVLVVYVIDFIFTQKAGPR